LIISILIVFKLIETFKYRYKILIPYTLILLIAWYSYLQVTKVTVKNIKMSIYQNRDKIVSLEQKRDILESKSYNVNTINFKQNEILEHADLGKFNYKKNFFIDFNATLNVLKDENYKIIIVSDDGFRLKIDNKDIISYTKERESKVDTTTVHLSKGIHKLNISYFQGSDEMAIRAYYEIKDQRYLFGENSKFIKFIPNR